MNKKWFSVVYLIFLISFVLWLWVIVINKQNFLFWLSQKTQLENVFLKELTAKYQWVVTAFLWNAQKTQSSIVWFIPNNWEYYNIFWNSQDIKNFLSWAILENQNELKKITQVESVYIDLDVEDTFDLKIIEWDANYFQSSKQLTPLFLEEFFFSDWQAWFFWFDWEISSSTWSLKIFDVNNDFSIFIKSWSGSWREYLRYELRMFDEQTGSWIFINPVYQNNANKISFFWYDIKKIWSNYLYKILNF